MQKTACFPPSSAQNNHWLVALTFLLGFFTLYFSAMPLLDDPDVPWHLATGELLLNTRSLPATDPWSFASNGAPWYLLSWLWNIMIGLVASVAGAFGVFIVSVMLYAALLAGQAWRLIHLGIDRQAVILTLVLTTLCMVEYASARPQIAGYILILLFHQVLHNSRVNNHYGYLLLLPLLMLIWVNAHGSFIAGFTLLGAYITEAWLHQKALWLKRLLLIALGCMAAALINPYGLDVLTGAMQSIDSNVKQHLLEWQPFTLGSSIGLSVWLLVFVLASNIRNPEVSVADKLLAFAWFIATLLIMRNGAIFVLVSAPYLASCLDMQTRNLRQETVSSSFINKLQLQPASRLWGCILAVLMAFIITVSMLPHKERLQSGKRSIQDAIAYIKDHEPGRRYLTDFDFGGQIIYQAANTIDFFMDSRSNTAYSSAEMKNYLAFWLQQPGWQQKIRAYGVNGIVIHKDSRFARAYADGHYKAHWHLVFAGNIANVYIAAP